MALPKRRSNDLSKQIALTLGRKSFKRRLIRLSFLVSNVIIIGVIAFFVVNNTKATSLSSNSFNSNVAAVNPLDQVSSADIALTVAQMNNLPESTAVANQAQTAAADIAMTATTNNVVSKPEVVNTALKSKADIHDYVASAGDSVGTLATKFGITSDSILWSNGLNSGNLNPGTHLTIPPVNGIVYVVKPGDTPDSLAARYRTNKDKIIKYNDAEISGLSVGERIIIPDAVIATASSSASPVVSSVPTTKGTSFPWGNGPIYGYNGYDFGYCTWYVATQLPVPSNWGNASSWAYYAGQSGWNVAVRPSVGAIAQTALAAGGEGHVAIVNAVSADGSQVQIRDMNGVAGWDRVGNSGWISASIFQHYITP